MTATPNSLTLRLLPHAIATGADNMAIDEALLLSALRGQATLRFYGWLEATVSLGYFQPGRLREQEASLAALPWVRRPSGGATLVHHHEVTYALALPPGEPWQTAEAGCSCWLRRMHEIIAGALTDLGIPCRLHTPPPDQENHGILCFRHFAAGDVLIGQAKVAGSAQRRHRGALLQHGALLLASSPHAPILPGIRELTACQFSPEEVVVAVRERFSRKTGWVLAAGELTAEERTVASELARSKYGSDAWNRKR
jgi:lipoate-protein ligase A